MGLATIAEKIGTLIIDNTWYNDFRSLLSGDFVGRNSSGVPTAGQNLGNSLYPWGIAHLTSLILNGSTVSFDDQETQPYKIVSGKKRSTSNQPAFLTPNGAAASATLAATSTNLVLEINGTSYSFTADVSITGLTTAPASNNTCLVNNALLVADMASRMYGEINPYFSNNANLAVDAMGSNISSKVGTYQAFKTTHGGLTEYFLARIDTTTQLNDVRRGYFYDSSLNPINRIPIADNDTITLMSLGWVFAKSNLTVDISYKNPTVDHTAPSGPATNDYWFDTSTKLWKQYNGATWDTVERILIGLLVIDGSNCVAARSFDFFTTSKNDNTMDLEYGSATLVYAKGALAKVDVMGQTHRFLLSRPNWDIATDLASSVDMYDATEQSDRQYYLYLTDEAVTKISDIHPYWRPDLRAWYHPHNPWRYMGDIENRTSDFSQTTLRSEPQLKQFPEIFGELYLEGGVANGSVNTAIRRFANQRVWTDLGNIHYADSSTDGMSVTIRRRGLYFVSYQDVANGGATDIGISVSSTQLTTAIQSITATDRRAYTRIYTASTQGFVCAILDLSPGDIVRAHTNVGITDTTATIQFRLRRIS